MKEITSPSGTDGWRKALFIAFMGCDGSGKTSLVRLVGTKLEQRGIKVRYHRVFDYVLLGLLTRKLFSSRAVEARAMFSKGEKTILLSLWPWLVLVDCIATYFYFKILGWGGIVIFDRYFYDFVITFQRLGYRSNLLRFLFFSLPRPDLGFVCDASPEVVYERTKNSHGFDVIHYEQERTMYISLAEKLELRTVCTEGSLEESEQEVLVQIYEMLCDSGQTEQSHSTRRSG